MYSDVLNISTITLPRHNNNNNNDHNDANDGNDDDTANNATSNTTGNDATEYIQIICMMDGTEFLFPKSDCILLPIVHATAEELAIYIYCQILNRMTIEYVQARNINMMEITVAEAPTQQATFRYPIPITHSSTANASSSSSSSSSSFSIDVRQFIMSGNIVPMPCLTTDTATTTKTKTNIHTTTRPTDTSTTIAATTTTDDDDERATTTLTINGSDDTTKCQNCDWCQGPNDHCKNNNFEWQMQRVMDAIHNGRLIVASSSLTSDTHHANQQHMTIDDVKQLLKL
jgi:hypothetical protein